MKHKQTNKKQSFESLKKQGIILKNITNKARRKRNMSAMQMLFLCLLFALFCTAAFTFEPIEDAPQQTDKEVVKMPYKVLIGEVK